MKKYQLSLHLCWFCSDYKEFFFNYYFEWQNWQNAKKFNVPWTTWSPESISRKWWWFSKLVKKGRDILALMHSTISSCLLELFICVLQFLNWKHQRHLSQWEVKDSIGRSRRMLTRAGSRGGGTVSSQLHKSQRLGCHTDMDTKMNLTTLKLSEWFHFLPYLKLQFLCLWPGRYTSLFCVILYNLVES